MPAIAYVRGTFGQSPLPAAPGAGANSGLVSLVTPDDNQERVLTGIYISDQTRLGHTQLFNAQRRAADVAHEIFAVRDDFLGMEEVYAPGIAFQFITFNDSGGAITVNTGIQLRYRIGERPSAQLMVTG